MMRIAEQQGEILPQVGTDTGQPLDGGGNLVKLGLELVIKVPRNGLDRKRFEDVVDTAKIASANLIQEGLVGQFGADIVGVAAESAERTFWPHVLGADKTQTEMPGIVIKQKHSGVILGVFEDFFSQFVLLLLSGMAGQFVESVTRDDQESLSDGKFNVANLTELGKMSVW